MAIAGACGTCGAARGATPRAWRANRRASGAQPAAAMGRGAGCAFAVVSGLRRTKVDSADRTVPGEEAAIAPPLRRCSPWKRFGRAALDPYLRSRALGTGPPDSIDGETGKAEQRIQYWHAAGAGARVSGPRPRNRLLYLHKTLSGEAGAVSLHLTRPQQRHSRPHAKAGDIAVGQTHRRRTRYLLHSPKVSVRLSRS